VSAPGSARCVGPASAGQGAADHHQPPEGGPTVKPGAVSPPGRPKDENRSAPREGTPVSATDVPATLRSRLASLAPAVLEIRDDSAAHAGHAGAAGGGGHFSLLIVSQVFLGLPRLQRHQRVLREVADLVPYPIHALSIKALTPEEFPPQP